MTDDTDGRLLPCPFCGSQSATVMWRDGFPCVRCVECYCGTGEYDGGSERRPIEAWNCRATHLDAQAAEIARLREALAMARDISFDDADEAGMMLMDGSITDLQHAVALGDVRRCFKVIEIVNTALSGDT